MRRWVQARAFVSGDRQLEQRPLEQELQEEARLRNGWPRDKGRDSEAQLVTHDALGLGRCDVTPQGKEEDDYIRGSTSGGVDVGRGRKAGSSVQRQQSEAEESGRSLQRQPRDGEEARISAQRQPRDGEGSSDVGDTGRSVHGLQARAEEAGTSVSVQASCAGEAGSGVQRQEKGAGNADGREDSNALSLQQARSRELRLLTTAFPTCKYVLPPVD